MGRKPSAISRARYARLAPVATLVFLSAFAYWNLGPAARGGSWGAARSAVAHVSAAGAARQPADAAHAPAQAYAQGLGLHQQLGALGASGEAPGGALPLRHDNLPRLFMFIGILSGRPYADRRMAVREAWANAAQVPGEVVTRFILSEDERTPQVENELAMYGDILFIPQKTDYSSILFKTYHVLEYATLKYDAAFVFKTDDDAFVNVFPMMQQLRALCVNKDCRGERVYLGSVARRSLVLLSPNDKWYNADFYNHTGLRAYPKYMLGGGYVLGGEVARALVELNKRMSLKFTPVEDATVGFWLMSMDIRHINHPKFRTKALVCCVHALPVRRQGQPLTIELRLKEQLEQELCGNDPWLVLHKIGSPDKMRYLGSRFANCSRPDPWEIAPAIEPFVSPETRAHYAQQRAAAAVAQQRRRKQHWWQAPAGGWGGGGGRQLRLWRR